MKQLLNKIVRKQLKGHRHLTFQFQRDVKKYEIVFFVI